MSNTDEPLELGTVREACKIVGGEKTPVHPSTYYRGVKEGRYVAPIKTSPNVSRVDLAKLRKKVREMLEADATPAAEA